MRKWLAVLLVLVALVCAFVPSTSFTEDEQTVLLARALYTMGADEDYATKLALGTVVMNRVEDPWFPNTLRGVLEQQQQFPVGSRYDEESLRAAHAVLSGQRALGENALYWQLDGASAPFDAQYRVGASGSYSFYSYDGRI